MEFSKPEYWSGLPCPPPGDLPNPGIEPRSPALQADSLQSEPLGKTILILGDPKSYWGPVSESGLAQVRWSNGVLAHVYLTVGTVSP